MSSACLVVIISPKKDLRFMSVFNNNSIFIIISILMLITDKDAAVQALSHSAEIKMSMKRS